MFPGIIKMVDNEPWVRFNQYTGAFETVDCFMMKMAQNAKLTELLDIDSNVDNETVTKTTGQLA